MTGDSLKSTGDQIGDHQQQSFGTAERRNSQDVSRASTGLSGVIADQGTNPSKSSHWTELCRVPTAALAAQLTHLKKRDVSAQDLPLSLKIFVCPVPWAFWAWR